MIKWIEPPKANKAKTWVLFGKSKRVIYVKYHSLGW
jgi:hypothetical protein